MIGSGAASPVPLAAVDVRSPWTRLRVRAEDLTLSLALAGMMLLPLLEALLRKAFQTGISGQTILVQHLTLVVGMVGAAVAARERRLLSLSSVEAFAAGRWLMVMRVFTAGVAATVGGFL